MRRAHQIAHLLMGVGSISIFPEPLPLPDEINLETMRELCAAIRLETAGLILGTVATLAAPLSGCWLMYSGEHLGLVFFAFGHALPFFARAVGKAMLNWKET